jgi:thioredoxin 1
MQHSLKRGEELEFFLRQSYQQPLLIKFATSWCSPCRQLQKEINNLLAEDKKLIVLEIDAENFVSLAQSSEFSVYSVPTLFLFHQGKRKKTHRGYLNLEQLREFVKI